MTVLELLIFLISVNPEAISRLAHLHNLGGSDLVSQLQRLLSFYGNSTSQLLLELTHGEVVSIRASMSGEAWTAQPEGVNEEQVEDVYREHEDFTGSKYRERFEKDIAFDDDEARRPLRSYQDSAVEAILGKLDPQRPQLLYLATGGGKTRVGNDVVVRWKKAHRGPVIWITKDWRLLKQALVDLRRRYDKYPVARLGGDNQVLAPLPTRDHPRVIYTTIQTLQRRIEQVILGELRPSLLVWDECHWGEHGGAEKILDACKKRRIPVLGLTATPRECSRYDVAFKKTFSQLVNEGYLARPIVEQVVNTGIDWSPNIHSSGDVTRKSLQELANNPQRNKVIVHQYVSNASKFGKTMMFACGIGHANIFARMLLEGYGIAARSIHSNQTREYVAKALEDFRTGKVQVLVNMEMLTHGIDIPDAQTVFLCRPTTSDILFSQMVGRAARRDEATGKTSFKIVEFTDNILVHGDMFEHARDYFQGAGAFSGVARLSTKPTPRRERHEFDPSGAPCWIPQSSNYPESCHGLWYRDGQTFGIEFEITQPGGVCRPGDGVRWMLIAERLRAVLAAAMPGRVAAAVYRYNEQEPIAKDNTVWNVEYDSTVGWEVSTPVLANADGFAEVDVACRALDEVASQLGLKLDHRTGTHIHLGWKSKNAEELKRAIQLVKHFEPGLATLVAPSRIAHFDGARYVTGQPNHYCAPIATVLPATKLAEAVTIDEIIGIVGVYGSRYVTFNVLPLTRYGTVEVRMHSGTLAAKKILLWVSLWQQILWAAAHRNPIDGAPDSTVIKPDGDIVALAQKYLPDARQPQQRLLLHKLAARRLEVVDTIWRTNSMLRRKWLRFAKTWQELCLTETNIESVQRFGT